MADISSYIKAFTDAVYGEDVRGAMVGLANALNEEVETDSSNVASYTNNINTQMSVLGSRQNEVENMLAESNRINMTAIESASSARTSETNSEVYSKNAQSYAVGGTNSRPQEDVDNARYYCNSAASSKEACSEILDQAEAYFQSAKDEVAGFNFYVEPATGELYVDTKSQTVNFVIDEYGDLYVEV